LETQKERIRVCADCGGVLSIDSWTDSGYHIYAVHIPRKACMSCQETGYQWYDEVHGPPYDRVLLQDRSSRQYLVKQA
jgi:hypothetical protein